MTITEEICHIYACCHVNLADNANKLSKNEGPLPKMLKSPADGTNAESLESLSSPLA